MTLDVGFGLLLLIATVSAVAHFVLRLSRLEQRVGNSSQFVHARVLDLNEDIDETRDRLQHLESLRSKHQADLSAMAAEVLAIRAITAETLEIAQRAVEPDHRIVRGIDLTTGQRQH